MGAVSILPKALEKFDFKKKVFDDFEEAEKIECEDTKSRQTLGKFRKDAKSIRGKINSVRLEINRKHKEKIDLYAAELSDKLTKSIDIFDEKIKAFDSIKAEKAAAKARAEFLRIGRINWHLDGLKHDCEAGLQYNLPSKDIERYLAVIGKITLDPEIYQEKFHEAKKMLDDGINATTIAMGERVKFEAAMEKQKAEAERLAIQKAKFEAEQAKKEAEGKKRAEDERIKRQKEEKKLKAEKEALEKQKAEFDAKIKVEAEKKRAKKYAKDWDEAHKINFDFDHGKAVLEHQKYLVELAYEIATARQDAKERWKATEQAKAEAIERKRLIDPDKKSIKTIADGLDKLVSEYDFPTLKTEDANKLLLKLISGIKMAIAEFEQSGEALE